MYFCGDSVLLNESHWVIICIIRIFGQIFGQNFGIWPPGVPIYMGISYWFAIYFEEIPPSLVLNVFLWWLCIIKWPKLGNYLHNTNIWGDFSQNFGIWPPGVPIYIYGCLLLVCHLNTTKPSPKCIFWYLCIIKWTKLGGYLHNTNIWVISGQNSDFWPPGVLICIITPYCFAIYFEEIVSCFALNAIFLYLVLSKDPKLHYTDISAFFLQI